MRWFKACLYTCGAHICVCTCSAHVCVCVRACVRVSVKRHGLRDREKEREKERERQRGMCVNRVWRIGEQVPVDRYCNHALRLEACCAHTCVA
jgi:hypothetical protein